MIDYSKIPSPCYLLEESLLRRNLELMNDVQERAGISIILAFKGFAMWSAFPLVRQYLKGATASSLSEAKLCFEEMKTKSHTYAVAYRDQEFDEIMALSSHITFNSLSQYERFKDNVVAYPEKISCGIRVNPEYSEVTTDLYNPSSPTSRLGMTAAHFGERLPEGIEGLHFHVLCESTSFTLENTLKAFEEKFGHLIPQVKWVNMGGGHLMTKKGYDTAHLVSILKAFREKWGVEVILEPGSAVAWETGDLVSTVLDVVENSGVKTAILDASFTCHMPDCLEMPYKPRIRGGKMDPEKGKPTYRMGGMSCLAGDYMSEYSFDKELQPGDLIVFEDMIHYTMVKTTTFNGVPHPSIGIWKEDNSFQLIRQFGYEDYRNRLS
ncbi:carboxynorspermidine decarboxylase [uncultured Imperialibacter sp.]|uniref:carboxynorspermidine decarboxylase n=1 Tax=uncultured Imperialibacter sp. TaxID=1672639 RepID=UPI0030D779F8|tara:strand:- start:20149 stop:21288 length:1140 start_codon:yes stop_codon:yes gene_type:complete